MSRLSVAAVCAVLLFPHGVAHAAQGPEAGATIPWTTYEAEDMQLAGGQLLGPRSAPPDKNVTVANAVEMEASQGRCVRLAGPAAQVQFTARAAANTLVIRYSLPDSAEGTGLDSTLTVSVGGKPVAKVPITSRYAWRYGGYPFSNKPSDGNPRNFFDEARCKELVIRKGDTVRISWSASPSVAACILDLVDLELVAPPLAAPADALSVRAYGALGDGKHDDTSAIQQCIDEAVAKHKAVFIPAGDFLVAGDFNNLHDLTIQGAGMWHTTLVGDPARYNDGFAHQVRFNGGGSHVHIADFSIVGRLDHRNDSDPNDGFSEFYGADSSISRVWVEHTKTGAWIANSQNLLIEGCRFRNTIGDGLNLCVGVRDSQVRNCTARGTGDDCFAIWPATYTNQTYAPGRNIIGNCTGVLTSLGNGGAIYGGEGNALQDCVFADIPYGCGVLIAGTFPVGGNGFSGTTTVQRCRIARSGGFDAGWNSWRGAFTICPQNIDISGLRIAEVSIADSLSYGLQIVSPGSNPSKGVLRDAAIMGLTIARYGCAVPVASATPYVDGVYGVWARSDAIGALQLAGLTVDGKAIQRLPETGSAVRNQSDEVDGVRRFTFCFAAAKP